MRRIIHGLRREESRPRTPLWLTPFPSPHTHTVGIVLCHCVCACPNVCVSVSFGPPWENYPENIQSFLQFYGRISTMIRVGVGRQKQNDGAYRTIEPYKTTNYCACKM